MGNIQTKSHPKLRNKKQVHWKAADLPSVPGKPILAPNIDDTPDLISLQWTPPVRNGGSPIAGYIVEHRRVGSPVWMRATQEPVLFPEITLGGLEPGWRYQFRTSAENAVGYSDFSELSEPITVAFLRSAITAPQFTQEIQNNVALENDKCEFIAHYLGQPSPKVCWFKDGFEIFSSRRIRILTEYDRSILTIHQTSLSDQGEIKCTITNRTGHASCKAKLTVEAPPSIRLPRNYENGLLFEIGEIIRFKVSIVGRPVPLVFWTHNGESLQNSNRYEIESEDKSSVVKIMDAKRSDRGEYQVKAINKIGESVASFLVTVTDKPSPPGQARVVMALGRSVTLSWNQPVDDGGCKIGNYIIEYYRLGWDVWLKAATTRKLTTILGELIEGSEYKFRIKAESPYGVSDPGDESDVVFIPDSKRGITNPPKTRPKNFLDDIQGSPISNQSKNRQRSHSSSRVEHLNTVENNTAAAPPQRPKRSKTKSQPQSPEPSPRTRRKNVPIPMNKTFFDRASIARELAYGTSEREMKKEPPPSIEESFKANDNSNAIFKMKVEPPPKTDEPTAIIPSNRNSIGGTKPKRKLIREHSATTSGSSEFMLILYSDENEHEQSQIFPFDDYSIPPPLSLSAPELGDIKEPPQFVPIKNSASSSELLHERTLARLYEANENEEEKEKPDFGRRQLSDISNTAINSKDNTSDFGTVDPRHLLRRKLSANSVGGHYNRNRQMHCLKSSSEIENGLFLLKDRKNAPPSPSKNDDTAATSMQQQFEQRKLYSQNSFERKPISIEEEKQWMDEYEESVSDSDSESEFSDMERFKFQVSHNAAVQLEKDDYENETYRPPGFQLPLSDISYSSRNEPFEILTERKQLPDPNFTPKPILKKSDIANTISPSVSSPTSKTSSRSLSPRPDFILKRNRSSSLAVPNLPVLSSSDEFSHSASSSPPPSTTTRTSRNRSFSFSDGYSNKKLIPETGQLKPSNKLPRHNLPSITKVAEITGITAASIVIPDKLLDKRTDNEANKIVADHYDHIVKSVNEYKKQSEPHSEKNSSRNLLQQFNDNSSLMASDNSKEPSKENLSQDSGYQSSMVGGYTRRNSLTDRPEVIKLLLEENDNTQSKNSKQNLIEPRIHQNRNPIRSNRRPSSTHRSKSPSNSSKRGTSVIRKSREKFDDDNEHSKQIEEKIELSKPRAPMLKEIQTQTSGFSESFSGLKSTGTVVDNQTSKVLSAKAEMYLRSLVEWLTDLALFAVACWLYLFNNELLALPILFCMIYRQLKEEFKKYIPKWIKKKFKLNDV